MQAGCCILLPAESFLRLAILAVQDGVWDGRRLLPAGYVADMATGTEANPHFGLSTFVAGPYVKRRGWANPDRSSFYKVLHGEPYLAADLFLFDGNMNQVVYMIPSQNMVVLRTGRMAPRSETSEWDNSFLPNTLIRGILRDKGNSTPQPM
jgi:CubicO group peptidase (beta-lactamase class C family)